MEDLGLEGKPKVKGGGVFLGFIVGVGLGVAGTILLPRYMGDSLPAVLRRSSETVVGPVLGKRSEEGRLLLTVRAQQGAVLATFHERVPEIDLLVGVGDTVTLGVARYQPFVDDPDFLGIRKVMEGAEPPSEPELPAGGDSLPEADEAGGGEGEQARPPGDGEQGAAADTVD